MSVSDSFIEFCGCATPPCRRCGPASELTGSCSPGIVQPATSFSYSMLMEMAEGRWLVRVKLWPTLDPHLGTIWSVPITHTV